MINILGYSIESTLFWSLLYLLFVGFMLWRYYIKEEIKDRWEDIFNNHKLD